MSERNKGVPKEEKYRWQLSNRKPELSWVDKDSLRVDHRYQRDLNDAKRLRIASEFDWGAFGVVIVARRPDGLWVVDGQHRLAAAKSRTDIRDIPVAIYQLETSEASAFLKVNKNRKPLTGLETFRAMVDAGDEYAMHALHLVESVGRTVGGAGPTRVACVGLIQRCVAADRASFDRAWPVIAKICEGHPVDNRLVAALFAVEKRLVDWNGAQRSISEDDIEDRLLRFGFDALMQAIGEASAYYKRGGEGVWARGCVNQLNYRLAKRYSLRGLEEER